MARYKADTLSQMMRHGYWVRVVCKCGNNATIDPAQFRLSGHTTIDELHRRFRCKLCKARAKDVHVTFPPEK